jgi:hypothetical protein
MMMIYQPKDQRPGSVVKCDLMEEESSFFLPSRKSHSDAKPRFSDVAHYVISPRFYAGQV